MFGLSVLLLVAAAVVWWLRFRYAATHGQLGGDYETFVDYGRRWLAGDGFYRAYQLTGPYEMHDPALVGSSLTAPNFYPPPFALVTAALTLLPGILWWAVPLAIILYVIASWRPAPWAWPVLAAMLCWPPSAAIVFVGGTTMWVAALVAAGLRWHWPAAFILLKPSFLPLAFIGARHRSWWVAVAVMGAVSLALLPMWPDYLTAMRNAQGTSVLYSVFDLPLVLLPVVAWLGRSPHGHQPAPGLG